MPLSTKKRRSRRTYHHGDLRAALLEVSLRMLRKQGAASFSLRQAARAVGVDVAACYRHFRNRQEVLIAIAQGGFKELTEEVARELDVIPAREKGRRLFAIGHVYLRYAFRREAEFRIMFGDSELHARDPRLRAPGLTRSTYDFLEEAVAASFPAHPSFEVPRLSLLLWAAVHGIARLALDGAVPLEEREAQALLDALMSALVRGLKA